MATIFSKIIAGEIPCHLIAETENCFAFLDIMPLALGHVLVVPKKEVDYIFDLEDDLLAELNVFSKKVAKAIEKVMPCERIGVAIIGFCIKLIVAQMIQKIKDDYEEKLKCVCNNYNFTKT